MDDNKCVICGVKSIHDCCYCKTIYCDKHFASIVMTGNCCKMNEEDYD